MEMIKLQNIKTGDVYEGVLLYENITGWMVMDAEAGKVWYDKDWYKVI